MASCVILSTFRHTKCEWPKRECASVQRCQGAKGCRPLAVTCSLSAIPAAQATAIARRTSASTVVERCSSEVLQFFRRRIRPYRPTNCPQVGGTRIVPKLAAEPVACLVLRDRYFNSRKGLRKRWASARDRAEALCGQDALRPWELWGHARATTLRNSTALRRVLRTRRYQLQSGTLNSPVPGWAPTIKLNRRSLVPTC